MDVDKKFSTYSFEFVGKRLFLLLGGKLFGDFGEARFAAGSSVLLEKTFFDGLVVFALDFLHVLASRFVLESLESGFDVLFDFFVFSGTLSCLTSSFFSGFDNRH